ncbi:hypothetical protein [Nocardia lasii]|uniref:DUF3618 domain-containing protein n=1 Tax=Nocardia lasii TaxID=1616107 RepID=A0ABW1JNA3_9NOCA
MTDTPDGPEESSRDRQEFEEIVADLTDEPHVAKDYEDKVTDAKYGLLAAGDQVRDTADQVRAATEEQTRQAADKIESSVPEPVADHGKQAIRLMPVVAAAISAAALVYRLVRRRR